MKKIFKKKYKKVGILGGTFDPPHLGHLYISKIAIKKIKLNAVIWLITKRNPIKKKPFLSTKIRLKLSKDILKDERKIFANYLDDKIKSSDTFNVLNYLKKNCERTELFLLIGSDNLINFHKWKKWKKIPELAKIVVFARQNFTNKALNSIAAKKLKKKDWLYIKSKKINISSSLIRKF